MPFAFSPTLSPSPSHVPARLDGRQGRALRERPPRGGSERRRVDARRRVILLRGRRSRRAPRALRPRGDHPVLPRHLPVRPRGPTDRAPAPVRSVAEHVPVANLRAPGQRPPRDGHAIREFTTPRPAERYAFRGRHRTRSTRRDGRGISAGMSAGRGPGRGDETRSAT